MMGGVPPGRVSGPWRPGVVGPQEVRDRRAEAGDGGGDRETKKAGRRGRGGVVRHEGGFERGVWQHSKYKIAICDHSVNLLYGKNWPTKPTSSFITFCLEDWCVEKRGTCRSSNHDTVGLAINSYFEFTFWVVSRENYKEGISQRTKRLDGSP